MDERIPLIQELLKAKQELKDSEARPIPNVPIEEDWSRDEVANSENFLRDIIHTVRDNDENGWFDLLRSCTAAQSQILEDATEGQKIENLYEGFDFGSTRGTRQEFAALDRAETHSIPFAPEQSTT